MKWVNRERQPVSGRSPLKKRAQTKQLRRPIFESENQTFVMIGLCRHMDELKRDTTCLTAGACGARELDGRLERELTDATEASEAGGTDSSGSLICEMNSSSGNGVRKSDARLPDSISLVSNDVDILS